MSTGSPTSGANVNAAATGSPGTTEFVKELRRCLQRLQRALSDAEKDLARFQRNRPTYPWPDDNPACAARPFEMMSFALGRKELAKVMRRPKKAADAFVTHGLKPCFHDELIHRVADALVRAIDGYCFEGDTDYLRRLRAARARLPVSFIPDEDLEKFWDEAVLPLTTEKYPDHFAAISNGVWAPWHEWIGVCEKLIEIAAEAGDWTQPIRKSKIQDALNNFHRDWNNWLKQYAAALRPAGKGTIRTAKQLQINLASPLFPGSMRERLRHELIRRL